MTDQVVRNGTFAELQAAIVHLTVTFVTAAHKFKDLPPSFWMALGRLNAASHSDDPTIVLQALHECHRTLGAPGDFGYGTPPGDALRQVYDLGMALQRHDLVSKKGTVSDAGNS